MIWLNARDSRLIASCCICRTGDCPCNEPVVQCYLVHAKCMSNMSSQAEGQNYPSVTVGIWGSTQALSFWCFIRGPDPCNDVLKQFGSGQMKFCLFEKVLGSPSLSNQKFGAAENMAHHQDPPACKHWQFLDPHCHFGESGYLRLSGVVKSAEATGYVTSTSW